MADNDNFRSKTGSSFSADGFAVVFRKDKMVLDFKNTVPRLDQVGENKKRTMVSEHQPILLTPERAKALKKLLEGNIKKYEEKHGEIPEPGTEKSEDIQSDQSHDYIA